MFIVWEGIVLPCTNRASFRGPIKGLDPQLPQKVIPIRRREAIVPFRRAKTSRTEETPMVRLRLANFVLAAGLGLACGCTTLSQCPLLERFRAHPAADPYNGGIVAEGEGPIVDGGPATEGLVPGGPPLGAVPSVTPQNTIPPLVTPPRIVPQPQAQPVPYTP
jgi:hypothetical protein